MKKRRKRNQTKLRRSATHKRVDKLEEEKRSIAEKLPPLTELVRGNFIEVYLECIRKNCKCHKSKKNRHGPYYRITYGKFNRTHHVYVPLKWKERAETWTQNYSELLEAAEKISQINIALMKRGR